LQLLSDAPRVMGCRMVAKSPQLRIWRGEDLLLTAGTDAEK